MPEPLSFPGEMRKGGRDWMPSSSPGLCWRDAVRDPSRIIRACVKLESVFTLSSSLGYRFHKNTSESLVEVYKGQYYYSHCLQSLS